MKIGVIGCKPSLPMDFPVFYAENAGNMIHANAPFEMFHNCVYAYDTKSFQGEKDFISFVDKHCSHMIITFANTIKLGDIDGSKYIKLMELIEKCSKPIVVFGLGIQSEDDNISEKINENAKRFIKLLSKKTTVIGVRGEMTKNVLCMQCDVNNVMVTGCPSIFSRPHVLPMLKSNLSMQIGRIAYSGTHYHFPSENQMFYSAIIEDEFLIEPVNKHNHIYYQNILRGECPEHNIPYYLNKYIKKSNLSIEVISSYFQSRYKLFRDINSWYSFNKEFVKATYGTRFHVNIASILSGKPALWITHDSRTRELVNFLHLPSVSIEQACNIKGKDLISNYMDYSDFFRNIFDLYENFNKYLKINDLPEINFYKYK
ncbi:MAG: polysaccharide pyruvyl transferase family protein [Campylobacteraceae bacterium]|jgi:polysaccharide pyruvyl transferase WcaK-like protein|nr:polysaccharide pyruvyl transferase family protein [Campylobacteraceae bacterium]